jgi:hypothetical protein
VEDRVWMRGKYMILWVPTGSGKNEAVFVPFVNLRSKSVPNRMTYSLLMRGDFEFSKRIPESMIKF